MCAGEIRLHVGLMVKTQRGLFLFFLLFPFHTLFLAALNVASFTLRFALSETLYAQATAVAAYENLSCLIQLTC